MRPAEYTKLPRPRNAATIAAWIVLAGCIVFDVVYLPTLSECDADVVCRNRLDHVGIFHPSHDDNVWMYSHRSESSLRGRATRRPSLVCDPAIIDEDRRLGTHARRSSGRIYPNGQLAYDVSALDIEWRYDGRWASVQASKGLRGTFTTRYRYDLGRVKDVSCERSYPLAWALVVLINLGMACMVGLLTFETWRRRRYLKAKADVPGARLR